LGQKAVQWKVFTTKAIGNWLKEAPGDWLLVVWQIQTAEIEEK
jgi:hypothetical protein